MLRLYKIFAASVLLLLCVGCAKDAQNWVPTGPVDIPPTVREDLGYDENVIRCLQQCHIQYSMQRRLGYAHRHVCGCRCLAEGGVPYWQKFCTEDEMGLLTSAARTRLKDPMSKGGLLMN